MKIKKVTTKKGYVGKDGSQKAQWLDVGVIKVLDDGREYLTMNHQPDVTYYIFEQENKAPKVNNGEATQDELRLDTGSTTYDDNGVTKTVPF